MQRSKGSTEWLQCFAFYTYLLCISVLLRGNDCNGNGVRIAKNTRQSNSNNNNSSVEKKMNVATMIIRQ